MSVETAANAILHAAAACDQVGMEKRVRQKIVKENQRIRVELLARGGVWNFEAADAGVHFSSPIRRKIQAEGNVVTDVIVRNSMIVQKGVLAHRADVPGPGLIGLCTSPERGGRAQQASQNHSLHKVLPTMLCKCNAFAARAV